MTTTSIVREKDGVARRISPAQGEYADTLRTLSEGSVERHFDPYKDIDWDSAEFAVIPHDKRWILQDGPDPLGSHPWYKALPEDKKIEIGMWRQANVAKVGLQFEELLIGGIMQFAFWRPNGSPEFRYVTHEVVEEGNHTLMFQEMVNRIGIDVPGPRTWAKLLAPFVPLAGAIMPELFFVGVLAGEEPIDHLQKSILRNGGSLHPIMRGVMAIHIAEEARHISFAHEFLRHRVPKMSRPGRFGLSLATPVVMRVLCDVIVVPPPAFFKTFDIPAQVKRDLFWDLPEARTSLRDIFGDVRALATEAGLMNPVAKALWKLCKIDGPVSRYRSEPVRKAA